MTAAYDEIGAGYSAHRRPDHRVAAAVEVALGDARSVVNVGAGTGSYEPTDHRVVAIEPSSLMIGTRATSAAPVAQARAEQLPVASGSFDAALVVLSLHHWRDWRAGVAELRRVAQRQVIFTFDPAIHLGFWLIRDYLPEIGELASSHPPSSAELVDALGGGVIIDVPVPADCEDGFLWAYWKRPEAYLDPLVQACNSGMAQLPPEVVRAGVARLDADLRDGTWSERNADLLGRDEIDGGFRLVVSA